MGHDNDILFEQLPGKQGDIGLVTLNRPRALNALNHAMINALDAQLNAWRNDNAIKAVITRSNSERAFCAGGDIRHIHDAGKSGDTSIRQFFHDEYCLNHLIHHYPKPYIPLLNGITMGGGVGISIHGSHRVATSALSFAMPETGIGFFPDIGGSYFLPRCRGEIGSYLGLTGTRISAADAKYAGLIDYIIESSQLDNLVDTLSQTDMTANPKACVDEVICSLASPKHVAPLQEQQALIDSCFAGDSLTHIIESLELRSNELSEKVLAKLRSKSPTSLHVTLRQLRLGAERDFDACMQMEYRMVQHFLQGHDFYEGVRAIIIDKDNRPQWQPATLDAIAFEDVERYFTQLGPDLEFTHEA